MLVELEYGEVSAVDYKTCRIRVRLDERDGVQSYWLNVPQRHTQGTKSRSLMPEIGEQVAVLLDTDGVAGVYLGGVYSTAEPPPVVDQDTDLVRFRDGTTVAYDSAAGAMEISCVGIVRLQAAQSVTVKALNVVLDTPQATLEGNLQVNGNVSATGTVMDAGGNSNHHSH